MKFIATNNKGFRIKFSNGYAVSVQWGPENYCERKSYNDINPREERTWNSKTAEIAVFNPSDGFVSIGDGDVVRGWVTPDDVAEVMSIVSSGKEDGKISKQIKSFFNGQKTI